MASEFIQIINSDLAALRRTAAHIAMQEPAIAPAGTLLPALQPALQPAAFQHYMVDAMARANAQDMEANRKMSEVDAGQSDDLGGAMLASQEAGLSFQMLMQVRNKVVGALDDLLKLPL